ncbi:MAG: hypothetical protein K8R88_06910 [Armatimonadetes bacterium]|nr:hypothetical protein [Armatimonadota bacterium]
MDSCGDVYVACRYGATAVTDIIKLDAAGQPSDTWANTGAGVGVRRFSTDTFKMTSDACGGVVLGGNSPSGGTFSLRKLDVNGNTVWASADVAGEANDFAIHGTDSLFVAGTTPSGLDYKITKYTGTGAVAWTQTYDGPNSGRDVANTVGVDAIGNAYVSGTLTIPGVVNGEPRTTIGTIKLNGADGTPVVDSFWPHINAFATNESARGSDLYVDEGGNVRIFGDITNVNVVPIRDLFTEHVSQILYLPPQKAEVNAEFAVNNQSIWPGIGTFNFNGNIIRVPWDLHPRLGGYRNIGFTIRFWFVTIRISLGEFGAEVGFDATGDIGLKAEVQASLGDVNANVPMLVGVTAPPQNAPTMDPGGEFTIDTSFAVKDGAAMASNPAVASAKVTGFLNADTSAFIKAKAFSRTLIDQTFSLTNVHKEREFLNTGNLLGSNLHKDFDFDGYLSGYVQLPQIRAQAGISYGAGGVPQFDATGSATFLSLQTDLTRIVLSFFGLTNKYEQSFDIGIAQAGVKATVAQVAAGANFDLAQRFLLSLGVPTMKFLDDNGNVVLVKLPNGNITGVFPAGTSVKIVMAGSGQMTLRPVLALPDANLRNNTDIVIRPQLVYELLRVSAWARGLGYDLLNVGTCIACGTLAIANISIDLYDQTFAVPIQEYQGDVVRIVGNTTVPVLNGVTRPCANLYLLDQTALGVNINAPDPGYFSERQKLRDFMLDQNNLNRYERVLVLGKDITIGARVHVLSHGHEEIITLVSDGSNPNGKFLNSTAAIIGLPRKMLLISGTFRIWIEKGVVSSPIRSNTIDLKNEAPMPNIQGVGPTYWAADPDFNSRVITVQDGGDANERPTYVSRRDYYNWLQKAYDETLVPLGQPSFSQYFTNTASLAVPVLPTLYLDGVALSTYRAPLADGRLNVLLPREIAAKAKVSTVHAITPGPGGGRSSNLRYEISAPLPVVTTAAPVSVLPGTEGFTLNVFGPEHVEPQSGSDAYRSNFNPDSVVYINGVARVTKFVSCANLQVDLTTAELATESTKTITVVTPSNGTQYLNHSSVQVDSGGMSNAVTFVVGYTAPTLLQLNPGSVVSTALFSVGDGAADEYHLGAEGDGYAPNSIIHVDGVAIPTLYESPRMIRGKMPASIANVPGSYVVTVMTPTVGTSTPLTLTITNKPVIQGTLSLADFVGSYGGKVMSVNLKYPNGALGAGSTATDFIEGVDATVDASGHFSVATTFVGTCDVYVKVNHWLNKKVGTLTLAGNGSYTLNASLPTNGDCNNDNTVDLTDYTIVVTAFNAVPGAGNWNPDADLNEDGIVDLTDYTIVVTNFNAIGNRPGPGRGGGNGGRRR